MTPEILNVILQTLLADALKYKQFPKGLVCDFKQDGFADCPLQECLDSDEAREVIADFYGKWPKDIPLNVKFDAATCFDYVRDFENPEKVTLTYIFMGDHTQK